MKKKKSKCMIKALVQRARTGKTATSPEQVFNNIAKSK